MKRKILLLKKIGDIALDLLTIKELRKKAIKSAKYRWKFDKKNLNLIPVLELYNNEGKIFKTFEAIEFSEMLQDLLKEKQSLFNCIDNMDNSEIREKFFSYLEVTNDCSECELRDLCPVRKD